MLRSLLMLPCDAFFGTFVRLLLGLAFTHDWDKVINLYWTLPFDVVQSAKYIMHYHLTIYNKLATALSRCTERTSLTKTENSVIYSLPYSWKVRLSCVVLNTFLELHSKSSVLAFP